MCNTYKSCGFCLLPVLIGMVHYGSSIPPPPTLQCEPECSPTAVCVRSPDNTYNSCQCIPGKTGENCTLDDPCLEQKEDCPDGYRCYGPCDPNFYCDGATGEPHCLACAAGWRGASCDLDINECYSLGQFACYNGGTCVNTPGDYGCVCFPGWIGKQCRCQEGRPCEDDIILNVTFVKPETQNDITYKKTAATVVNVNQRNDHLLTTVSSQATRDDLQTTPDNGQSKLSTCTLHTVVTLYVLRVLLNLFCT